MSQLFDDYACNYDEELSKALSASGEGREFFAEGRVAFLGRCLAELGDMPASILDYGCGDGATTPLLLATLGAESAIGVDVSGRSIEVAQSQRATEKISYRRIGDFRPSEQIDIAYCNGVFHHIPPHERPATVAFLRNTIRPGGLFALWENNPWSPATRYVMSRCAFDKDAILLSHREARQLLRKGGFAVLRTDFCFIFPRSLRALRGLEEFVHRLPIGTQYQVLARRLP